VKVCLMILSSATYDSAERIAREKREAWHMAWKCQRREVNFFTSKKQLSFCCGRGRRLSVAVEGRISARRCGDLRRA
jgi:hypothetical protein